MGQDRKQDAHKESLDWRERQIQQGDLREILDSFMDYIELHKLTLFPADEAEKQHYYIQQRIKKPQQVTVRPFVSRMGVLNDYLAYLPTVFDLLMAVAGTKKMNVPFNEVDLAGIMLNGTILLGKPVQHDAFHAPQEP